MTVDSIEIVRRGAIFNANRNASDSAAISANDFREREAKILAKVHAGQISMEEAASLIKALEESPARTYEFRMPIRGRFLEIGLGTLKDISDNNRAYFMKLPTEQQRSLLNLSLSGKADNELESIIKNRTGTVNVFASSGYDSLSLQAQDALEEIAFKAYRACSQKPRDSLNADHVPGGIMVINHTGSGMVEINPQNFSKIIVAIVGFGRVQDLHIALQQIYSGLENYKPGISDPGQFNELQMRENLAKRLIGQMIYNDVLKYL